MEVYGAMKKQVRKHLEAFHNDFKFHDLEILKENKGYFIWILRKSGTHIYFASYAVEAESWFKEIHRYYEKNPNVKWFVGHTRTGNLRPITPKTAMLQYQQ